MLYHGGAIGHGKLLILTATPYHILAFMQDKEQSGYSKRPYSFIDQRLLAPV